MAEIQTPVSPGELLDKITILEIKTEEIAEDTKLANVKHELALLTATWNNHIQNKPETEKLKEQLLSVNRQLWQIEDDIRDQERRKDFGPEFIRLARSVYVVNDQRADLKKQVNQMLGSNIQEEKSYSRY